MIILGSDHAGFDLKNAIIEHLKQNGVDYKDIGTYSTDSVDYPTIAIELATAVANKEYELGILCCGTGIGMSMAANKVKGVRAACCSDEFSAEFTRRHNDANVLCLGGRVLTNEKAFTLVDLFLNSPFEGDKHLKRINMIADYENK